MHLVAYVCKFVCMLEFSCLNCFGIYKECVDQKPDALTNYLSGGNAGHATMIELYTNFKPPLETMY